MATTTQAARDILAEREKQRAKWGDDHDDEHADEALAAAAAFMAWPDGYTDGSCDADECLIPKPQWAHWLLLEHEGDRRQQIVIAAALMLAEIERLDRAAGRAA